MSHLPVEIVIDNIYFSIPFIGYLKSNLLLFNRSILTKYNLHWLSKSITKFSHQFSRINFLSTLLS